MMDDIPRLQPYDESAERALLSLGLQVADTVLLAPEFIGVRDFYFVKHQLVWAGMLALAKIDQGIDVVTLAAELEQQQQLTQAGGRTFLAELLLELPVTAGIDCRRYAQIIRELAVLRGLIRLSMTTLDRAYAKDVATEVAEQAERALFELVWSGRTSEWVSAREMTLESMAYIDRVQNKTGDTLGTTTGLRDLDTVLGGWQRSDLVIVGARPSMGKTALACMAALAASRANATVGIVSMEMSRLQLGLRFLSMGAALDISALRQGQPVTAQDWSRLSAAAGELENSRMWVDDGAIVSMESIRAKARQLKIREGLDVLIVDYLQLMSLPARQKRYEALGDVSRGLKMLAKELNLTVIALSQVSRECEKREDKRPTLSDLRESGALEQDADVVLCLYRDEYYNADTEDKGIAEILVRKHRNGATRDVRVGWLDRQARFVDLEEKRSEASFS